MQEIVFTYILALYMFRVGVRRNNTKVMMVGRLKFALLFYGLNKYNYQQIEILDSMMRLSAPPDIQHFIHENESMTRKLLKLCIPGNPLSFYTVILKYYNKAEKYKKKYCRVRTSQ